MESWKKFRLFPHQSIFDCMQILEMSASQFAVITNKENQLLGVITDGDIRRGILNGLSLEGRVDKIMNQEPMTVTLETKKEHMIALMQREKIRKLPVLNHFKEVVDVVDLDELLQAGPIENPVVLMAGGLGSRLGELTKDCPKPLIKVGERPILEIIINNFKEQGFHNFFLSVNYKAEMIEEHFGDGKNFGVSISYLKEPRRLGTAGALSLLNHQSKLPLIVMNGDLLTKVNFKLLLDYHERSHNISTMCIRKYELQVPYGVIGLDEDRIMRMDEKPVQELFVNAGIYVLNQESLSYIPQNEYFDMPHLFDVLMKDQHRCGAFPIHEYWMDIGKIQDLEVARNDFHTIFAN